MKIRKTWLVAAFTLIAMLSGSVVALAAHEFSDVPASNVFHDDVAWLADAGVTFGCNPPANDRFCPDDAVTRAQMAAFLHRFADMPVETTIAIDQVGFLPIRENDSYLDYDYNAVGTIGRTSPKPMGASVALPDGATVTGFSATFCDSTNAADYTARLIRRPDPAVSGAYAEVMAEATSSGDGCSITVATSEIENPVVDTTHYSYAVEVWWPSGSTTFGNLWIRRATVTYERPLVP